MFGAGGFKTPDRMDRKKNILKRPYEIEESFSWMYTEYQPEYNFSNDS